MTATPGTPQFTPATISGPTNDFTNINTPGFTGTTEANATVEVDINSVNVGTVTADGTGVWTYTSAQLTDNSYTIAVIATGQDGIASAASSDFAFAIDTIPPDNPTTLGPSGEIHLNAGSTQPTFSWAAVFGADHYVLTIDGGSPIETQATSYTPTLLQSFGHGSHTWQVSVVDQAGNVPAPSNPAPIETFFIDSLDPDTTIIAMPNAQSSSASATFTFTGQSNNPGNIVGFDYLLDGSLSLTFVNTGTVTLNGLSEGSHTFKVYAQDRSGAIDTTPAAYTWTVDTIPPAAPSAPDLASASDSGASNTDNITKTTTPTFTGSAEDGATVNLYDTGGVTLLGSAIAAGGLWSITTSALSEGDHTITATATDAAGNVGVASARLTVTIDTTPPAAPSAPDLASASDSGASNTDNITKTTTPTFTGSAEDGATVNLYDTGGVTLLGSAIAAGGLWSITTSALSEGDHTITATATDAAGNAGVASAGLTVTIDTTPPAAPAAPVLAHDTGTAGDKITSDPTITYPTPASGDALLYKLDSGSFSTTAPILATEGTANGQHTVTIAEQDAAGNISGTSGLTFTLVSAQIANNFGGDGHSDILWQNADGTPAIWMTDGTSLMSGANVGFNPGPAWHVIGSGDFNGDGKAEILWQNNDGTIAEWFVNGAGPVSGGSVAFNPGPTWHAIGTGDFNGDGKSDILWQNADGTPSVWLMDGLNILSGANAGSNPGPTWHVIGAGDFNGDGKADILWQNADGTPAVWLMNGTNLISGSNVGVNPGSSWRVVGTGDFNGDGKADILWQNADGTPAVWLMNGTSLISGASVGLNPGPAWHALNTGDYNGDGKADILWQNSDGTPAIWLMNGTSLISGANIGFDPGSNWHVVPQHHDGSLL